MCLFFVVLHFDSFENYQVWLCRIVITDSIFIRVIHEWELELDWMLIAFFVLDLFVNIDIRSIFQAMELSSQRLSADSPSVENETS